MTSTNSEDATAAEESAPASEKKSAVAEVLREPAEEAEPSFDLMAVANPSFNALEGGRAEIFETPRRLDSFRRRVRALSESGEEGRKRGLGLWMVGDLAGAVTQLRRYEKDDVAAFTLAQSLMSLGRFAEAEPIFGRLSAAYPDEPRPRCGALEARLEKELASEAEDAGERAAAALRAALESVPASFKQSAEYHYLRGRAFELEHEAERALDEYAAAHEKNPGLRQNLFHAGYLAERSGLDDTALAFYEELVALRPADANVLVNLGVLYEDLGFDREAAACYDTLLAHSPTDVRARLYLRDAKASLEMFYDEDLERKEDRLNQILRIPITDFELSVRARNCLNKMQITTLGDLVCRTEQELLAYKNFGETSLNEIKEILRSKNLRLGMPREEAVASIESRNRGQVYSGEQADVLNRPVHELQISIRARRTVETLGCLTLGDVVKHSADELLGMPNFGVTSLQELRAKLTDHGLKLRGD